MLAYEAATAWNRGIHRKILKLLIKLYLFCLLIYCSNLCTKKVIRGKIFWYKMNMLAYEADTAWNRWILSPFKTLIQLYLLRSFLYSLTYCIKEVIKGKIFRILNEKSASLWGSYGLKQGNPLQIFKTLIQLYLFCLFLYFWLTLSKRVSKAIFLGIQLKSVGLWGRYGLK